MGPKKNRLSLSKNQRDAYSVRRAQERREAREAKVQAAAAAAAPDPDAAEEGGGVEEEHGGHGDDGGPHEQEVHVSVGTQTVKTCGVDDSVDKGINVNLKPSTTNQRVQTKKKEKYVRSVRVQCSITDFPHFDAGTPQTHQEDIPVQPGICLEDLSNSLRSVLSAAWSISHTKDNLHAVIIGHRSCPVVLKSILLVDNAVGITVHGQPLKNNHPLWDLTQEFSIGKVGGTADAFNVFKILAEKLESLNVCEGCNQGDEVWDQGVFAQRGFVDKFFSDTPVYRSNGCQLLLDSGVCLACRTEKTNMVREVNRRMKRASIERDLSKINLKYLPKHELINALTNLRKDATKYRREIQFMKKKIDKLLDQQSETIGQKWSSHFTNINKANYDRMTPLQQLFWDQQLKRASLKNKASMKWHPMMIRLALHLEMTSPAASEILRKTGLIALPGKRTIFDYSHFIDAKEGCQREIIEEIRQKLEKNASEDHEKFVNLMFDGMHVKANLVFSKKTGELIGYAKLTKLEEEFENLQAQWSGSEATPQLAKEVLVFMVKTVSVNEPGKVVKNVVAVYSIPPNMKASGIYTRLWDVIYCLEGSGIPVLAVICDGASQNRACLNMHPKWVPSSEDDWYDFSAPDDDHVHTTVNVASPDLRPLFFIVDPPHWLKTLRNSFGNSYCHKKSRRLWNQEDITWQLIVRYYEDHKNDKFRKSLITRQHVYLTSFSCMNVSLAAKVLSKTLASAIQDSATEAASKELPYPPYKAAVKLMKKCNDAFDCVNGHNITSDKRFRNENLAPYTSTEDPRFQKLREFVDYFEKWHDRVMAREGNFSKKQRKAMLLPEQTTSAIAITVAGFTGAVRYLLKKGAKAVCARRFCQDPLEQIFSVFRRRGGSSNHPDVAQVLQTNVSVFAQGNVALPSTKGNTVCDEDELEIDSSKPKRRKTSEKSKESKN